jgi:hypothetical protein
MGKKILNNITGDKREHVIILNDKLIKFIMESTKRFEFVDYSMMNTLIFWDNIVENEFHVHSNVSIDDLMDTLKNLYVNEAEYKGRSKIQLEMKKLLNIY